MKRKLLLAAALILVGLGLDAFWFEPRSLEVTRVDIPVVLEGASLTVAVLADLHVGMPHMSLDRLRDIVAQTNALHPDLIVLLGDYVEGRRLVLLDPEPIAAGLQPLHAPLGVYAVLGNHDGWFDAPRVTRALESAGISVLANRAVRLEHNGHGFWLAGIEDLWTGHPDVAATLAQTNPAEPVILLSHNPDPFATLPARVNLFLAGHTHGGQVKFPWIGALITYSAHNYVEGVIRQDGRTMFLTRGLGTSTLPVRFLSRPEIALLHLK